jgi:hypothetical protein
LLGVSITPLPFQKVSPHAERLTFLYKQSRLENQPSSLLSELLQLSYFRLFGVASAVSTTISTSVSTAVPTALAAALAATLTRAMTRAMTQATTLATSMPLAAAVGCRPMSMLSARFAAP